MSFPLWKRNLYVCWFGAFATAAGMSQIVPFLPLFIEQLGVHNTSDIERWAGLIFGATFLVSAIVSPIWGSLADKYGRKPMLIRAGLGMSLVVLSMAFVQNVYELFALRLIMGLVSGFIPASIILVATQTPRSHSGWALGMLSTGGIGGSLVGPLIGGFLSQFMGMRMVFIDTSILLFCAFLASLFFIKEKFVRTEKKMPSFREVWKIVPSPGMFVAMFITTFMVQLANMSIEPIITVYVKILMPSSRNLEMISGIVVSAAGLASVISAPLLGKLSDRIGPRRVLLSALIFIGFIFIPQAFVSSPWQLMGLRFLMGLAIAGILPSINTIVKKMAPPAITGQLFGYNQSAQFLGTLGGALLGGHMAAQFGMKYVFFSTSALLFLNAGWVVVSAHLAKKGKRVEARFR
ncbi:multidrug efflux MFS transporter [Sporolactobacillus sp. CQH2019]|uniref:multidrug efflux MFS transporter n=1 Tax=Sporolactobacillus sp. CQH2019 TaxID=3023512 RepID=UPI00236867EF|nr:multidrug efflux MFS transporter [Sporolactobacillus sp. CQH2019]MDD9149444.1 multidrug efflux MFS transporter [Sporolactobacillus sp. CQH2019]